MGFSDIVELEAYDPIISEMSGILGEQCGLSADSIVRDELNAYATIDYSGGQSAVGDLDSPAHDISYKDIVEQYAALEAASALPVDGEDFVVIIPPPHLGKSDVRPNLREHVCSGSTQFSYPQWICRKTFTNEILCYIQCKGMG